MRVIAATIGATLLAAPLAHAQTPAPAAPVPEAMPFDIPYGMPIALESAQKAIAASVAEAKKHNWKMAVVVLDPAGNMVAEATMDGTQYASIAIAQAKAGTAAPFRRPSGVFQDAINKAPPAAPRCWPRSAASPATAASRSSSAASWSARSVPAVAFSPRMRSPRRPDWRRLA